MKHRAIAWAGVTAGLAAIGGSAAFWRYGFTSPPPYMQGEAIALEAPLRPWEEHDRIVKARGWPYVFRVDGRHHLVYFGAGHTQDPRDPQIAEVRRLWESLQPTAALCEGRLGFFAGGFDAGVRMFGESGAVYRLARRGGVPIYSLELPYEREIAAVLAHGHIPKRVALYYTLRVFWGDDGHHSSDPATLAAELLRKRTDVAGLRGTLSTVAEMDELWAKDQPGSPSWRSQAGLDAGTPLEAVEATSRRVRTEHMARAVIDLALKGERVFAIAGGSHVIRQEPAIRAALGLPPPEPAPERGAQGEPDRFKGGTPIRVYAVDL